MNFKKNKHIIILFLILALGFTVRLYRLNSPIADWHSWRQADTSSVSRHFVNGGFDVLHPRFDDLSNVASGFDNPKGYRFVEFPIYNIKQAALFKAFGGFSLEAWGRLVSIFSSITAALFLYLIVKRHSNTAIGLLSAFFYTLIPYNIFYGRTILPDSTMIMAILGGINFFDLWLNFSNNQGNLRKILFYCLSILFTASSLLLKPYALFFTLPMLVLVYNKWGIGFFKKWQIWFFAIISLTPLVLWRVWITQFPEGIASNAWLLNGNGIRFRPAFFRWILYERLTKLISGYLGLIILLFGVYKLKMLKEWIFFLSFLVSSILYVVVFATGNVQHDYYQILIMPSLAIFFAIGAYYLYLWNFKKIPVGRFILAVSVTGLFWFGWMQVRDYFNINNPSIVVAGKAIDRLTPKDATVIANYGGDTAFLYQTKRSGWASIQSPLPEMILNGADYLIVANPTKQDLELGKTYKIVEKTPQYVIFDLKNKQ